jgi:hypothetical protein
LGENPEPDATRGDFGRLVVATSDACPTGLKESLRFWPIVQPA